MSALVETPECFPRELVIGHGADALHLPASEPNHDACAGGQHLPGVLGGWHCPCPCHRRSPPMGEARRQLSFADQPPYVHQETSVEAAEAIKPSVTALRAKVYDRLLLAGWDGMTDQELQRALRLDPSTERPRRGELVDAGLVADSGRKRRTLSGRRAIVWVCR